MQSDPFGVQNPGVVIDGIKEGDLEVRTDAGFLAVTGYTSNPAATPVARIFYGTVVLQGQRHPAFGHFNWLFIFAAVPSNTHLKLVVEAAVVTAGNVVEWFGRDVRHIGCIDRGQNPPPPGPGVPTFDITSPAAGAHALGASFLANGTCDQTVQMGVWLQDANTGQDIASATMNTAPPPNWIFSFNGLAVNNTAMTLCASCHNANGSAYVQHTPVTTQ
jgi:hypothetical protein